MNIDNLKRGDKVLFKVLTLANVAYSEEALQELSGNVCTVTSANWNDSYFYIGPFWFDGDDILEIYTPKQHPEMFL